MNCDDLPEFKDQSDNLCMDRLNGTEPNPETFVIPDHLSKFSDKVVPLGPGSSTANNKDKMNKKQSQSKATAIHPTPGSVEIGVIKKKMSSSFPATGSSSVNNNQNNLDNVSAKCKCDCLPPLIRVEDHLDRRFYNRVETGGVMNCLMPCHSLFFSPSQVEEASSYIGLVSWISLAICLMTVSTYLIDSERFKYPGVGIIFISGCYLMVSAGFLIRWYSGHEGTACEGRVIRYSIGPYSSASSSTHCLLSFLLIYSFSVAAGVWWVILCLTWYLSAGRKWGPEAIAGYSVYFHVSALLIPVVYSFSALGSGAVDGDPFTGICSVGNMNTQNLKNYVLVPLIASLSLGGIFLFLGFISMFQLRSVLRQQGTRMKADRLEKLMIRIIVFSILYSLPTCCVIASYYVEYRDREGWETELTCGSSCFTLNNNISSSPTPPNKPVYWAAVMKHIGSLLVGIFTGFWIMTPKTVDSWCRFFGRIFSCCGGSSNDSSVSSHHYHTPHTTSSSHGNHHHSSRNGFAASGNRERNSSHAGHGSVGPLGGSQLLLGAVTGNYINNRHRSSSGYKHIPPGIGNQVSYSSTSHIGSSVNGKSIPLTHV
jgi:frizzled protein 5/8